MRSWVKGGIIGAILYPVANIVFLFAALCGFASDSSACRLTGWIYMHFFPSELLEEILNLETEAAWYGALIIAGVVIGFVIGAIITLLIQSIRRN